MSKIIITGGSGFVGEMALDHFTKQGHQVTLISRSKPTFNGSYEWFKWDGKSLGNWMTSLEGADIVLNLAGKSISCRYTEENKAALINSRLDSTKIVAEALNMVKNPPKLWMNASSATVHSNGPGPVGEDGHQEQGFSPDLVRAWESAFFVSNTPNVRKVALRMGLILDTTGSTMTVFKRLARLGLGGKMGIGNQHVAWLHKTDLLNMIDFIIENPLIEGPVNAVSPNPTPNRAFMKALRKNLGVPFGLPATKWMIKLGAAVIGTSSELVLWNRNVVPTKLINSDFRFKFPTIDIALRDLLQGNKDLYSTN